MDANVQFVVERRVQRTMEALEKNRFETHYVENRERARDLALSLIPAGATVTHGGSQTLVECGIVEALKSGGYQYLDRAAPGLTPAQVKEIYRKAFSADCYLGSANAITEAGNVFNVDGNGNRVAAYLYGPASVILVAGVNKLVPGIEGALMRLRKVAAPANVKRLTCQTPCYRTGECMNCKTPARICCDYVVQSFQREPGRVKIILVGEELGY